MNADKDKAALVDFAYETALATNRREAYRQLAEAAREYFTAFGSSIDPAAEPIRAALAALDAVEKP